MGRLFSGAVKHAALILLVISLAGVIQPAEAAPPVASQNADDKRVLIVPKLRGILKITRVTASGGARGFLKIQVNVKNTTDSMQHFSYRIEWFDAYGDALAMATTSIPWKLRPHEESSIAASAPSPAARDFGMAFMDQP